MKVELIPITQRNAKSWVNTHHRHLSFPQGDLFRVGLSLGGVMIAVGVAGRPCRMFQDGRTVEFTRIASIAESRINACSRLYGALRRAGESLGYIRFVTYTLEHELGISPKSAGFEDDGLTEGGEWSRPTRLRNSVEQPGRKRRWICPSRSSGLWGGAVNELPHL